jgi:Tol biopolymer transport system component
MSTRRWRIVIAAVSVVSVVGVIALLPGSSHPSAKLLVRGSTRTAARNALDVNGTTYSQTTSPAPPTTSIKAPPSSAGTVTVRPSSTTPSARTTLPIAAPTTVVPTRTTTTVAPVASPATGRLAVTVMSSADGSTGPDGIATMAANGSNRQVLITGTYNDPQWTPDGRFIVFENYGTNAILAIPAGGGLISHLGTAGSATLSPDGTRLVEVAVVASGTIPFLAPPPQLSVQPVAETLLGMVTTGPATSLGVDGVGPIWAPSGAQILYDTQVGPQSTGLAIVNADGTGNTDLLAASAPIQAATLVQPGFSGDGATISFVGTDTVVYLMDSDGQDLRPALPPGLRGLGAYATAWAPDGHDLAVLVDGATTVVEVDTNEDVRAAVHLTVGALPTPGISFDASGKYLYYQSGTPPHFFDLYSVALDGGVSHLVGAGNAEAAPTVLP